MLAADSAAMGLTLLAGGVIADRYSRTAVMAVSDVVRSVAVLGYALAPASSPTALLVCFAVLEGFGVALFQPAWRAVLPQVVPADRLREVNAVVQLTNRGGLLLGAALGGVLVATVGPRPALLLDAATYMLSLTTLLVIRLPAVVEQAPEGLRAALHEAREGHRGGAAPALGLGRDAAGDRAGAVRVRADEGAAPRGRAGAVRRRRLRHPHGLPARPG